MVLVLLHGTSFICSMLKEHVQELKHKTFQFNTDGNTLVQEVNRSLVHLNSVLLATIRKAPCALLVASWDQGMSR